MDPAPIRVCLQARYDGAESFSIGSGEEISIDDPGQLIAEITGFASEIRRETKKPRGRPGRCLVSRVKEVFDWEASMNFRLGSVRTVDTFRESASVA